MTLFVNTNSQHHTLCVLFMDLKIEGNGHMNVTGFPAPKQENDDDPQTFQKFLMHKTHDFLHTVQTQMIQTEAKVRVNRHVDHAGYALTVSLPTSHVPLKVTAFRCRLALSPQTPTSLMEVLLEKLQEAIDASAKFVPTPFLEMKDTSNSIHVDQIAQLKAEISSLKIRMKKIEFLELRVLDVESLKKDVVEMQPIVLALKVFREN